MGHRQDLNTLSAADRQALVDLMLTYLNDDVVDDHMAIVHSGVEIFTGHRAYIAAMEGWLQSHGGAAFVPLPYWNSANPIPPEFDVVKPADDGTPRPPLMNLNPNMPKPAQYEWPAVCTYEDPADLGDAINGWHGSVHCAIGGSMCMIAIASAAPIFWCWHAFVDHIYWDWQRCTVICPDLVGSPLTWARHQLRLAGLTVGTVTRLPRVVFPGELPPFRMPIPLPDPPPFVHSLPERHWTTVRIFSGSAFTASATVASKETSTTMASGPGAASGPPWVSTASGSRSRCGRRRRERFRWVLRRIVRSQARGWRPSKDERPRYARSRVSWTRSSASAAASVSDKATRYSTSTSGTT